MRRLLPEEAVGLARETINKYGADADKPSVHLAIAVINGADERDKLRARQQELLITIRTLSQQVPYAEESGNVAVLIAEVGTLRAKVAEQHAELADYEQALRSTCESHVASLAKLAESERGMSMSCPCVYVTPCHNRCTCVTPLSSSGCRRCCSYGSLEQRTTKAEQLARCSAVVAALVGAMPKCAGRWLSGSGGHRVYDGKCERPGLWDVGGRFVCDEHHAGDADSDAWTWQRERELLYKTIAAMRGADVDRVEITIEQFLMREAAARG